MLTFVEIEGADVEERCRRRCRCRRFPGPFRPPRPRAIVGRVFSGSRRPSLDINMAHGASSSPPPPPPPPFRHLSSSSPPPQNQTNITTVTITDSSSPGLPSPSSFFTKHPVRQATGLTTAASVPTSHQSEARQNGTKADEERAGDLPNDNKAATLPKEEQQPKRALGRKSRRPLAKSASFVLNSDDLASTQFAGLDATQVQGKKHEDEPEKPKRAPRKPKKSDEEPVSKKQVRRKTAKQSTYFEQPAVPQEDSTTGLSIATNASVPSPSEPAATPVRAHRRRLSWTPAKNTTSASANFQPETSAFADSVNDERPALSLAAVLGDLAYAKNDNTISERSASGEALLKRRRIELADEATTAPKSRKRSDPLPVKAKEKVKKVKVPKKKPQTITEIATKAYRSEESPAAPQATVSSFFAAQDEDSNRAPPAVHADETTVKLKKPRKPREKKVGDDAKDAKSKKAVKPKAKAKVRFNEDDRFGELYEPEKARLQEKQQDFLFGTSSQLGTKESPTFIRHMQLALSESEVMSTEHANVSPTRKSYIRVPTAPHGTSLSCGQATRELWCSAARDHENEVLAAEDRPPAKQTLSNDAPRRVHPGLQSPAAAELKPSQHMETSAPETLPPDEQIPDLEDENLPEQTETDVVDLCYTSPVPAIDTADPPLEPLLTEELPEDPASPMAADNPSCAPHVALDEDWMMLRSGDSSSDVPLCRRESKPAPVLKPVPQLKRSTASPTRDRCALQALDANVSPGMRTSPHKASLLKPLFPANTKARQKISRTRSKKAAKAGISPEQGIECCSPNAEVESQPLPQAYRHSPSKIFSASQPIASSDFINIDEISDSEPPNTPSPPRRRATLTPSRVRPLDLEVVASPSVQAKSKTKKPEPKDTLAPALAWSKLKPDDATWIAAMPILFPQITATVKSTAPSNDMAKPSWYEKILLYDPIVLEDLTAWLNERGVRVETKQLKARPKVKTTKKKKKKKNEAELEVELVEEAASAVDEYETVRELLKPWMVQRWCEDKSICCLWKEGLRGGVRTRY